MKRVKLLASVGVVATGVALAASSAGGVVAAPSKPSPGPIIHLKNPQATFKALPAQTHGVKTTARPPGPDVDSVVNFEGTFRAQGFLPDGSKGGTWVTDTVGNPPEQGGTTNINAPIVPVVVNLLDIHGQVAHTLDPQPEVQSVLDSPVFSDSQYSSSSTPTQISDAVQRAEFAATEKADWHTRLVPSQKATQTMNIPFPDWQWDDQNNLAVVSAWTFQNLLFPTTPTPDTTTPIGAAEIAGDITTHDISTFLTKDVYLFDGDPSVCCILGFHTVDVEAGDASNGNKTRFYAVNYSSWIGTSAFGDAFTDVTALSHEIAETYNDPFVAFDGVTDITPWWLAPNGLCQDDLETGDVIEGLPHATIPITMPNGTTYHPQNEALIQWFEEKQNSDALGGAFSYPDTTVLTKANSPQQPGCA